MRMFIGNNDWNEDIETEEREYDTPYSMFMHDEDDYGSDESCSIIDIHNN